MSAHSPPQRKNDSWLDLEFYSDGGLEGFEAMISADCLPSESGLRNFLRVHDWRWPLLEGWTSYFSTDPERPLEFEDDDFSAGMRNMLDPRMRVKVAEAYSATYWQDASALWASIKTPVGWSEWCCHASYVAFILGLTLMNERHTESTRTQARESGHPRVQVEVEDDHPLCQARHERFYLASAIDDHPPYYPGCHCWIATDLDQ